MVRFDENMMLVDQLFDHHGLMKIYTHLYATAFLFLASLAAVYIIYRVLAKDSPFTWPGIMAGMISTGLIGLGEFAEHFFSITSFGYYLFHYLHMLAAPIAIYFFYVGSKEFIEECDPEGKVKPLSSNIISAIFGSAIIIVVFLAWVSKGPWGQKIEGPFLYITLIPMFFLIALILVEVSDITESIVMIFIPFMAVSVSLLALDMWFNRFSSLAANASLWIIGHVAEDILHAATGTLLLLFAVITSRAHRLGVIYICGVPSNRSKTSHKIAGAE